MSKQRKPPAAVLSVAQLAARVRWALEEGRTRQAVELAKELHEQEPTPAHLGLVKRAYLARAKQLRLQGNARDTAIVLDAGLAFAGEDAAWREKAAEELAAAGYLKRALALLPDAPGSPAHARVLAQGVDQAVRKGAAGRGEVPEALQNQFDGVLQAFAGMEAGRDEEARAALQGVGLQSPFLEWKLLLRGLAAYYGNDDVRALENWGRLSPDRLPARLAAPLRFAIDPAFRAAQEPKTQAALQTQLDRLQDPGLVQNLRAIQAALATGDESLARPFRLAEGLLPQLRQSHPQAVARLASCFYWAVVAHGEPADQNRYRRVFGPPADDPAFARLQALVTEQTGQLQEAHRHWQAYEAWVAAHPAAWPPGQADHVRALVWARMGGNAALIPDEKKLAKLPKFLHDHPDRPKPLRPDAETCFRRSIELAPDRIEPYERLFHYHQLGGKARQAEKAARQLLERFPDHLTTLEELADLRSQAHDYAEAVRLLRQALQANPLDRALRERLGTAHLFHARSLAEASSFEEARGEFQTALALNGAHPAAVLCKWAACEFKAGDAARAEELMGQALAGAGHRLAVAYGMVIEAIRLKLPRPLKTRFNGEFAAALSEPPTAAGAVSAARTAADHRKAGVTYLGQKTHEKKVTGYLDRAREAVKFSEAELEELGPALLDLDAVKLLRSLLQKGRRQFPRNPLFPLLDAKSYLAGGPAKIGRHWWRVKSALDEADRLVAALPPDEKTKALRDEIRQYQEMAAALDPFGGFFENVFGGMNDFGDDWDDG